MTQQPARKIQLINTPEYRENYANSVQIRVNLWDFFLMFGRVNQTAADNVAIHNFQGIYLSPQQAKALLNILQQNVTQYEAAFGEIKLEPYAEGGIVQLVSSPRSAAPPPEAVAHPPCSNIRAGESFSV